MHLFGGSPSPCAEDIRAGRKSIPSDRTTLVRSPTGDKIDFWAFEYCTRRACQFIQLAQGQDTRHLNITRRPLTRDDLSSLPDVSPYFAISYTWGHPHQEEYIGHTNTGEPFYMHLGEQWDRRDWVALLRELSWNEGGATRYGWIDQLRVKSKSPSSQLPSLPITAVESHVLREIPFIFRTCEVFAVFPGHRCQCLEQASPKMSQGCLSIFELVSWWSRLWPRQEFMYARRIQVKWVKQTGIYPRCFSSIRSARQTDPNFRLAKWQLECLPDECRSRFDRAFWYAAKMGSGQACQESLDDQGVCTRLLSLRKNPLNCVEVNVLNIVRNALKSEASPDSPPTQDQCPCRYALDRILDEQEKHYELMLIAIKDKMHEYHHGVGSIVVRSQQLDSLARSRLKDFLCGSESLAFYNPRNSPKLGIPPHDRFDTFARALGHLGTVDRQVTEAKDLVGAVFTDCPGYHLNRGESRDYVSLLEDAVRQAQSSSSRAFITTTPSGLFFPQLNNRPEDSMHSSWSWRPSFYLERDDNARFPRSTSYAYGVLATPCKPVRINFDSNRYPYITLHLHGMRQGSGSNSSTTKPTALSRGSWRFESLCRGKASTGQVQDLLAGILSNWPKLVRDRCLGPMGLVAGKTKGYIRSAILVPFTNEKAWLLGLNALWLLEDVLMNGGSRERLLSIIKGDNHAQQVVQGALRLLQTAQSGVDKTLGESTEYSEMRGQITSWRKKRRSEIEGSVPSQAGRDHLFFQEALRQARELSTSPLYAPSTPLIPLMAGAKISTPMPRSEEKVFDAEFRKEFRRVHTHTVMHIDTVYYLAAEALGLRPKDINLDYENSQDRKKGPTGEAYKDCRLRLIVSNTNPRMLGFTSDHAKLKQLREEDVMTVEYKTDETSKAHYLYEVARSRDEGKVSQWYVIGVWVPVSSLPEGRVQGAFGGSNQGPGPVRLY